MELTTLYTHNSAQDYVLFDFTTEELDEVQELAENTLRLINHHFERLTKTDVINQMIAAKFEYDDKDQPLANHLIFTIESPNKLQPENIECVVFYKEHTPNIEVLQIATYFGVKF